MAELALHNRDIYKFWTQDLVRFADLDPLNHLNNTASSVYCEAARTSMMCQLLNHDFSSRKFNFVIANLNLSFLKQVDYPNDIKIGTCVTRLGNSSIGLGQGLFIKDGCFSVAESTLVWVDLEQGKGTALPAEMRTILEGYFPLAI